MEKVEIKTSFPLDMVYHLLAHLDLAGNPANLYSPSYVQAIEEAEAKKAPDLGRALQSLGKVYRDNFQSLAAINFIPYYTGDIPSLVKTLLNYPGFTLLDRDDFIKPFCSLMEEEEGFFRGYWEGRLAANAENIESFAFYLADQFAKIEPFFRNAQRRPEVYLSVSLTRYGRGFPVEGLLAAAVPLPKSPKEYEGTFLQLFHEYTHPLTDGFLKEEIKMSDDSHNLSERVVIVADYYLLERLNPGLLPAYLRWLADLGFSEAGKWTPRDLLDSQSPLDPKLQATLLDMVEGLCR